MVLKAVTTWSIANPGISSTCCSLKFDQLVVEVGSIWDNHQLDASKEMEGNRLAKVLVVELFNICAYHASCLHLPTHIISTLSTLWRPIIYFSKDKVEMKNVCHGGSGSKNTKIIPKSHLVCYCDVNAFCSCIILNAEIISFQGHNTL